MIVAPVGDVQLEADAPAVARAVAERLISAAAEAIAARGAFVVALAGGSSPRAAYEYLALPDHRDAIDWGRTLCLFGDERCVPPDDDASNYRMAREAMLAHVSIPDENVLRLRGEDEPAAAAAAYARALTERLGPEPVIDLVLLGLGPDAHTASWFPGVAIDGAALVDAPYVPKFGTHRLTLTPRVVNAARAVVVATSGEEKADALAAVFGEARDPERIPSQRLRPTNGTLTWIVDRSAAEKLDATDA